MLVSQFSVTGAVYTCCPDLVGFVNGRKRPVKDMVPIVGGYEKIADL